MLSAYTREVGAVKVSMLRANRGNADAEYTVSIKAQATALFAMIIPCLRSDTLIFDMSCQFIH
jgi:hypothetical protein